METVKSIPPTEQVRAELSRNLRERDILKRLLRLAQRRDKLTGANP